MKRFLIIPLALIAFGVTSCAGLNESIFKGGASLTASIQNPVTREQQAAVEATYQVAVSTALSYARLRRCKDGETASPTNLCSKWLIVQKFKTINRSVFAQLKQLRGFMDANDQVNAIKVYNAIQNAIANFKSTAVASGV